MKRPPAATMRCPACNRSEHVNCARGSRCNCKCRDYIAVPRPEPERPKISEESEKNITNIMEAWRAAHPKPKPEVPLE